MLALPRLLKDMSLVRGVTKTDYTDFFVEELPLYPLDGHGTHTFFQIEKSGLSTMNAVNDIARVLNIRRREIGLAGLKDARAVTRQWLSIEHIEPSVVQTLDIPRIRVLEVNRHGNKLRLGHLRGNQFVIKIRDTEPTRLGELQHGLAELTRLGVPNYFGPQRFGGRGDAWAVGQAILYGQPENALDIILGQPNELDRGNVRRARKLYELGNYEHAIKQWPGMFHDERRALRALARSGGKKHRGLAAIDKAMRRFYVSAYQSHLFNQIVAERVKEGLDRLWPGDLAWIHANGAVFRVEDVSVEQVRAERGEISPSGPLFGYRMTEPTGRAGELENHLLNSEGLTKDAFRSGPLRVKGARRAIRFLPEKASISLGADDRGTYLELRFVLPRGCYATALLREMFVELTPEADAVGSDETED